MDGITEDEFWDIMSHIGFERNSRDMMHLINELALHFQLLDTITGQTKCDYLYSELNKRHFYDWIRFGGE